MSDNGKRGSYGSTDKAGPVVQENAVGSGSNGSSETDDVSDLFCFDDIRLPFPDDCYMQQIREQSGVTNGPSMVNYQYARSRRR